MNPFGKVQAHSTAPSARKQSLTFYRFHFVRPHSQVPSPVRFVVDSLTTRATESGTLSARTEAKESGPASSVVNP